MNKHLWLLLIFAILSVSSCSVQGNSPPNGATDIYPSQGATEPTAGDKGPVDTKEATGWLHFKESAAYFATYLRIKLTPASATGWLDFKESAASHSKTGPDNTLSPSAPNPQEEATVFDEQFMLVDEITGKPISDMRYELHFDDGTVVSGVTGKDGLIPRQTRPNRAGVTVKLLGTVKKIGGGL